MFKSLLEKIQNLVLSGRGISEPVITFARLFENDRRRFKVFQIDIGSYREDAIVLDTKKKVVYSVEISVYKHVYQNICMDTDIEQYYYPKVMNKLEELGLQHYTLADFSFINQAEADYLYNRLVLPFKIKKQSHDYSMIESRKRKRRNKLIKLYEEE